VLVSVIARRPAGLPSFAATCDRGSEDANGSARFVVGRPGVCTALGQRQLLLPVDERSQKSLLLPDLAVFGASRAAYEQLLAGGAR